MSSKELIAKFELFLKAKLPVVESFHPHFNQALGEMLDVGGKRFRPLLLLSVVESSQPLLVENALHVALGLEMMHTYSLIHDDLPCMDNAPLRRGHPTLHVSYDETTAVLIGDALNTHAFYLLANAPLSAEIKIKLVSILSSNSGIHGMVLGQAIDCFFEDKRLNVEELTFLHLHKTAKLIAASLVMGAVICELDKTIQEALYQFGLKLGLLFQVQDDIIDATLSSEEAGKPTHNDGHKNSFVNLLGLEDAQEVKQKLLLELDGELEKLDAALSHRLKSIVEAYFKG
ncbi:polyprenyl synthetase family protein [Sulfurospirillum multivorans]|uniref:Farnesyl diphosphate synthase n=2 Tax=Sulfurospirillum multivorans TaxID=66821 RepID=A0AA86ANC0_SULMK|nr:polyprenyl synthetase family protein [Sulfurospirillum multivorans]AHJ13911.1 farnesyl diphosphate synthase [Sulfurospirillum multivorans DSM 12446]QEH07401.1 farnesyl diphosphate synthase [Sulfurospirillum multivorans]